MVLKWCSQVEQRQWRRVEALAAGRKKAAHAGMHDLAKMENRSMIRIGG